MVFKLNFKFQRDNYSLEAMHHENETIRQNLKRILEYKRYFNKSYVSASKELC